MSEAPTTSAHRRGRRRRPGLDDAILDAAIAVLAERGYDGLTIDLVAARAGAARATVYRRWPAKAGLVLDAVARLSAADVDDATLPDTGTLRDDLAATILPLDDAGQQVRIQAMAALLAVPRDDHDLAEAAERVGIGPWIELSRELIERAVARGEFDPPSDLDAIAEVIPSMCVARAAQRLPLTRDFCLRLIDHVILPALRGTTTREETP